MGIFEKFKSGFKKSASAFTTGLRDIVVKKEIDDKTLDKIEDYLIQSDVGIVSASEIREIISQTKIDPNKDLTNEINNILKNYIISIMKPLENIKFFKKKEKLSKSLFLVISKSGNTIETLSNLLSLNILKRNKLDDEVKKMINHNGPYLLEVMIEKEENVFPMIPSGSSVSDIRLE